MCSLSLQCGGGGGCSNPTRHSYVKNWVTVTSCTVTRTAVFTSLHVHVFFFFDETGNTCPLDSISVRLLKRTMSLRRERERERERESWSGGEDGFGGSWGRNWICQEVPYNIWMSVWPGDTWGPLCAFNDPGALTGSSYQRLYTPCLGVFILCPVQRMSVRLDVRWFRKRGIWNYSCQAPSRRHFRKKCVILTTCSRKCRYGVRLLQSAV